ncbi:hypothetical protein BKA70DRAFT_845611 [Coprinopsis sp. MPI-PUGE-AT-0042]|nr:hypothetical protein BKA70DRAFT_845611 [Coprinopsis sp. MPI-PUGE-AT-0042]
MLVQGVYYIIPVCAFAIAQVVLHFRWKTGFLARLVSGIRLPLSGLLTARFMLQLRKCYKTTLNGNNGSMRWNSVCEEFSADITFIRRPEVNEGMDDDGEDAEVEVDEHARRGDRHSWEAHRVAIPGHCGSEERGSEQNV